MQTFLLLTGRARFTIGVDFLRVTDTEAIDVSLDTDDDSSLTSRSSVLFDISSVKMTSKVNKWEMTKKERI